MITLLKILAAGFLVLNIPTFLGSTYGPVLGGVTNALSYLLLICYAIVTKRLVFIKILLFVGLGYFAISGIQFHSGLESSYFDRFLKYILVVLFGGALASELSREELLILFMIASSSVIVHSVFFSDDYGRYSGLFLDPNAAGFICIMGYGLTFCIKKGRLKTVAQVIFTFAGLITFSRTFIVLWLLLNFISLYLNPKNLKIFFLGFGIITLMLILAPFLNLNPIRFKQFQAIVGNEEVSQKELNEDSRTDTWATFYPYLFEKPVFGHGYGSFQTNGLNRVGPHNTFILVFGESGFIIFLALLWFYGKILYQGSRNFRQRPHIAMMTITQVLFLITNHNYFTSYYLIFISLWLFIEANKEIEKNEN